MPTQMPILYRKTLNWLVLLFCHLYCPCQNLKVTTLFMLFILLPVGLFHSVPLSSEGTFAALAIIAENSFWLSPKYPSNIQQATEHYLKSSVARNVSTQIQTSFSNKISAIQSASVSEYTETIATPLADVVLNNLLRKFHLH
jgi:hypothetical protein